MLSAEHIELAKGRRVGVAASASPIDEYKATVVGLLLAFGADSDYCRAPGITARHRAWVRARQAGERRQREAGADKASRRVREAVSAIATRHPKHRVKRKAV